MLDGIAQTSGLLLFKVDARGGGTFDRQRLIQLENARLTLFVPLRFMLASPVETPAEAFQRMGMPSGAGDPVARPVGLWIEEKYDGVRCQLHVAADGGPDGPPG